MLPAPRKVTRLEAAMNRVVVAVLAALGAAALVLASASMVWEVQHPPARDWYLGVQVRCCAVAVPAGCRLAFSKSKAAMLIFSTVAAAVVAAAAAAVADSTITTTRRCLCVHVCTPLVWLARAQTWTSWLACAGGALCHTDGTGSTNQPLRQP